MPPTSESGSGKKVQGLSRRKRRRKTASSTDTGGSNGRRAKSHIRSPQKYRQKREGTSSRRIRSLSRSRSTQPEDAETNSTTTHKDEFGMPKILGAPCAVSDLPPTEEEAALLATRRVNQVGVEYSRVIVHDYSTPNLLTVQTKVPMPSEYELALVHIQKSHDLMRFDPYAGNAPDPYEYFDYPLERPSIQWYRDAVKSDKFESHMCPVIPNGAMFRRDYRYERDRRVWKFMEQPMFMGGPVDNVRNYDKWALEMSNLLNFVFDRETHAYYQGFYACGKASYNAYFRFNERVTQKNPRTQILYDFLARYPFVCFQCGSRYESRDHCLKTDHSCETSYRFVIICRKRATHVCVCATRQEIFNEHKQFIWHAFNTHRPCPVMVVMVYLRLWGWKMHRHDPRYACPACKEYDSPSFLLLYIHLCTCQAFLMKQWQTCVPCTESNSVPPESEMKVIILGHIQKQIDIGKEPTSLLKTLDRLYGII